METEQPSADEPDASSLAAKAPRASALVFVMLAISVPLVTLGLWLSRRSFFDSHDCEAYGDYGCSYDPNLAAGYGAGIGVAFLLVAGLSYVLSRKHPLVGFTLSILTMILWFIMSMMLLAATQS